MRLGGLAAMDRLQQLIFSFYREDPELQDRLEPLRSCRMRRSCLLYTSPSPRDS